MKTGLQCGHETVGLELPESTVVLEMKPLAPLADAAAAVREALAHPIGSPPLVDLARGRESACIVISDITRPVPNETILTPLLETLETAGIARGARIAASRRPLASRTVWATWAAKAPASRIPATTYR